MIAWSNVWLGALPCKYGTRSEMDAAVFANDGAPLLQLSFVLPQQRDIMRGLDPSAPDFRAAVDERAAKAKAERAPLLPAASAVGVTWINGRTSRAIETRPEPFPQGCGGSGSDQHAEAWQLPSPTEPLADTALEVRIDDATYMLALPYGLCRDEREPVPPPLVEPASAPIVGARRWRNVNYVSVLYGPWRLSLDVLEPGQLDVALYAEDGALVPPKLTVAIDGRKAPQSSGWRDGTRYHRVARFDGVARGVGRHYAKVELASVFGTRALIVPSSLLRYAS